jgi:hypothetical protein
VNGLARGGAACPVDQCLEHDGLRGISRKMHCRVRTVLDLSYVGEQGFVVLTSGVARVVKGYVALTKPRITVLHH